MHRSLSARHAYAVSVKIGRISVRSSFVSMGQFQLFVSIPVLFVFVALPIGYHKARVGSSTYHFFKTSSQSVSLLSWCLSALHFFCCFSVALWVCVVFSFFPLRSLCVTRCCLCNRSVDRVEPYSNDTSTRRVSLFDLLAVE